MKLKHSIFYGSLLALSLSACNETKKTVDSPTVQIIGSLKEAIWKNQLTPLVSLDTLDLKHVYGVGPKAGLQGENITFDGINYSITIDKGQLKIAEDNKATSPYFVFQKVPTWVKIKMDQPIENLYDLGTFVLSRKELLKNRESAVKIEGKFKGLEIAIHNLPDVVSQYTYAVALNTTQKYQLSDVEGTIIGFFDAERTMRFSHHDEQLILYYISKDKKTMGRITQLFYDKEDIQLYLPKY